MTKHKLTEKPKLNIPVVSGSFYWVRPFEGEDFEPAKCTDYYGNGNLHFRFTNGGIMAIERAWEVEVLNYGKKCE